MPGLAGSVALAVVAVVVIWKGSEYFEGAARLLSRYYGLPLAIHGAVVAIGSSFPEISSIVISVLVLFTMFALGATYVPGGTNSEAILTPALATLVFIIFTRTDLELTHLEAYGFLGLCGLFVLWVILESTNVIEAVQGI